MSGFATSAAVRAHLVHALEADLVGPYDEREELERAPSRTYLTGFLVPREDQRLDDGDDPDPDDDSETEEAEADGEEEPGGAEEDRPAGEASRRRQVLPASMGLSVLLPKGDRTDTVTVTLRCAEYEPFHPDGVKKTRRPCWRRRPHPPYERTLTLDPAALREPIRIEALPGVELAARLGESSTPKPGTRALSVFVVNRRAPGERGRRDAQMVFQVSLEVEYAEGFLARPALRRGADLDDQIASLQYRDVCEYAVGHGVAVEPHPPGAVRRVKTTWLPRSEVPRVATTSAEHLGEGLHVEQRMRALADLADADAVRRALGDLPTAYGRWIAAQAKTAVHADDRETLAALISTANLAAQRIAAGIELLAISDEARAAFALANRAMADQARQRLGSDDPAWRLFQLAFVLLCLPSVTDDRHPERAWVELIFFPTGGGKTEAYLGVIAYTLVLRRMRGRGRPDAGLGVAVILRYTLRLLTLDQYERATTLICALELLRRADPATLGDERFSVGLWVGSSATSNTMMQVKADLGEYRKGTGASPCPLARCPWCKRPFTAQAVTLDNPKRPSAVIVGCENDQCEFSPARHRDGVPVVFVDEQVYRELPPFVVGTVDKFAMVPWRAETGMLFGRVAARTARAMIEPGEPVPKGAKRLPQGLRPPELIVQDELHLISGPLGTMVGLYETAVEELCRRDGVVPKVLASTATVRRAAEQVQALMGRACVRAFPPQGPDPGETFFATVDRAPDHGRLYLGVAAPGRAFRAVQARVYQTLLAAAQYAARDGEPDVADPYLTLVGYFNALRELGAMRRVVEDEVPQRAAQSEKRRPLGVDRHPFFASRTVSQIVELTSRESTAKVKEAKDRLGQRFSSERHVDVVLASNMISVGVDIDRLGLMVVAGQPTTSAEYIQASSRVGRDHLRPGLVVTCYNVRRVRDRSFFERFCAYHQSFYGWVEATSVTPFSQPALDRALAGVLFAMVRHGHPALAPARGAMAVPAHGDVVDRAIDALVRRAEMQPDAGAEGLAEIVRARARDLADAWNSKVAEEQARNIERGYSPFDLDKKGLATPMLLPPGAPAIDDVHQKLAAPTSMRDTEPTVHLWLRYVLGRKSV